MLQDLLDLLLWVVLCDYVNCDYVNCVTMSTVGATISINDWLLKIIALTATLSDNKNVGGLVTIQRSSNTPSCFMLWKPELRISFISPLLNHVPFAGSWWCRGAYQRESWKAGGHWRGKKVFFAERPDVITWCLYLPHRRFFGLKPPSLASYFPLK